MLPFRMGWCKMAALASQGSFDEPLLWRDFERYRESYAALAFRRCQDRWCASTLELKPNCTQTEPAA